MKKVALTELDPRLQKQITAADQQLKTNPQYAVEVLSGILARNPGCIDVRRSLRKAQKAREPVSPEGPEETRRDQLDLVSQS